MPESPSRLDCTYALPTEDAAREYREREQKHLEYLYQVEMVGNSAIYAVPLNASGVMPGIDQAAFYWENARPYNGDETSLPPSIKGIPIWWELLINGPIKVIRMLD
ncbi:hypothetical protein SAMN05421890_3077 [Ensifer adhaerens]|nr:hypothetical protein SAMN05421890_3077 [Ensifer adhaerens]